MGTLTTLLSSLLLLVGGVFGAGQPALTASTGSVELGIVETSPRGHAGGYAVPASGSTYECNQSITLSKTNVDQGETVTVTLNGTSPSETNPQTLAYRYLDGGVTTATIFATFTSADTTATLDTTGFALGRYRISNPTGCAYDFLRVNMPPPVVTFSANPVAIPNGGDATLAWTVTNADSCTAAATPGQGNWQGSKAATDGSHTQSTGPLSNDVTYSISCTNVGGTTAPPPVFVDVVQPPIAEIEVCRFDGSTATDCIGDGGSLLIAEGDDIRVGWNGGSEASTTCQAASGKYFDTDGDRQGTQVISGLTTTDHPQTYTVECSNPVYVDRPTASAEVRIGNRCEPLAGLDTVDIVRVGDDFSLFWQKPVDIASCTVAGGGVSVFDPGDTGIGVQCVEQEVFPVTIENETQFTMSCDYPPDQSTVNVQVIPRIEEI